MTMRNIEEFEASLSDENPTHVKQKCVQLLNTLREDAQQWSDLQDRMHHIDFLITNNDEVLAKLENDLSQVTKTLSAKESTSDTTYNPKRRTYSDEKISIQEANAKCVNFRSGLRKTGLLTDGGVLHKDEANKKPKPDEDKEIERLQNEIRQIKELTSDLSKQLDDLTEKTVDLEIFIVKHIDELEDMRVHVLKLTSQASFWLKNGLNCLRAELEMDIEPENNSNVSQNQMNRSVIYTEVSVDQTKNTTAQLQPTPKNQTKTQTASNDYLTTLPPKPASAIKKQKIKLPTMNQFKPVSDIQGQTSMASRGTWIQEPKDDDNEEEDKFSGGKSGEGDIKKKISELAAENKILSKKNEHLQKRFFKLLDEQKLKGLQQQEPEVKAKPANERFAVTIETLMHANKNLNDENTRLTDELNTMKELNPDYYNVNDLLDEYQTLKANCQQLDQCKAELEEARRYLQKEMDSKAERNKKLETLKNKKNYYKQELRNSTEKYNSNLNRALEILHELEMEINQLKDDNNNLRMALLNEKDATKELKERISHSENRAKFKLNLTNSSQAVYRNSNQSSGKSPNTAKSSEKSPASTEATQTKDQK